MPALSACQITLSASERHRLKKLVRTPTAAQQDVTRASIVLLAARPLSNNQSATRLGISVDTVRKWRGRYAAEGRDGLAYSAWEDTEAVSPQEMPMPEDLPESERRGA